jgi:hypothetical protein
MVTVYRRADDPARRAGPRTTAGRGRLGRLRAAEITIETVPVMDVPFSVDRLSP